MLGCWSRRALLGAAMAMLGAAALPQARAADKLAVAAVYTVPVEQQWVSRIHKALKAAQERGEIDYVYSENTSNTDYERVMREYAEAGKKLIIGEAFGVERGARAVAKDYPDTAFLMGSSLSPAEPNFSVFDNYIQDASYLTGMVAGLKTKSNKIGMVGGYPIPEVNRLMHAFMAGALEVNPRGQVLDHLHRLLVRPAQGQGGGLRHDRCRRRRAVCRALRRLRRGQGAQGPGHRQRHRHPVGISRHGGGQRAVAHGADHRPRPQGGRRRQLQGRGLRPVQRA